MPMDILALLRQRMADPSFLDRLASSPIDPAPLASQVPPVGLESLYAASPQASQVPLPMRQGMQPAAAAGPPVMPAAAAGLSMLQQAQPQPGPRPPMMPPGGPGLAPAQIQGPLPVSLASRGRLPHPSLGALILGR